MIFVLLRAFANGGSSLTGIEAVSNAVSAFRPPEGINARKVLVTEGLILGSLVAGISWLAHVTHAAPYDLRGADGHLPGGEDRLRALGRSASGMYIFVQAATALILYTGGNTSFNGFPFLASFVAEDAFLPRWLTKRGHRLVFSNGIVVLAVLSCTLLAVVGANVNKLVPFYAIGVFTAFTMAGLGMAKYHHRTREPGWRRRLVINFSAGRDVRGRRGDLRRGQVHRGRVAGRDLVRDRRAGPDPAEPGVPDGGRGAGPDQHPAQAA